MKKLSWLALFLLVILGGCKDEPITTDFDTPEKTILAGTTITFQDLSVGGSISWNWTFEGGSPASSTLNIPSVTYNTPGTYDVSLTTSNEDNSDNEIKTDYIIVLGEIGPSFSLSTSEIDAGGQVVFTDHTTGSPTTWEWSFPGGTPATSALQNPTVVYNVPGEYSITLKASHELSNETVTLTNALVVHGVDASFSLNTSEIDAGGEVIFTDNSTHSPTAWEWSFPGGTPATSTSRNPTVVYNVPGVYSVTLRASNPLSDETVTQTDALVVHGVDASFSLNTSRIDPGSQVVFTDHSTHGPTAWEWSFPGGTPATSTAQNPTVVYNVPGSYSITLKASNALSDETITLTNVLAVQGLVSHYKLDGNANDSGPLNLTGVVSGALLTADRNGVANSAYSFDGNDDITLPNNPAVKPLPVSVSVWIKFDDVTGSILATDFSPNMYSGVGLVVATDKLVLNIGSGTGNLAADYRKTFVTNYTLQTGQWYHIVGVFESLSSVKGYVNGVEVSGTFSGTASNYLVPANNGTLGRTGNPADPFKGSLDDFRVYNKVLSAAEVAAIFAE